MLLCGFYRIFSSCLVCLNFFNLLCWLVEQDVVSLVMHDFCLFVRLEFFLSVNWVSEAMKKLFANTLLRFGDLSYYMA